MVDPPKFAHVLEITGGDWLVYVRSGSDAQTLLHTCHVRGRSPGPDEDARYRYYGTIPYDPTGNYEGLGFRSP